MIALLCSVPSEAELVLARLSVTGTLPIGSTSIVQGSIGGRKIALCVGGMGKVNACHAATLLITGFSPSALIVFGVGGAYPSSGAVVGDVAVATEEIAGDEGVLTADGFRDTEYLGIPLLKTAASDIYNIYPASARLMDLAREALASRSNTGAVHTGVFVTLSTCTGTMERARELEDRYHGLCENMEGAAAAHVALAHGIPWLEVRGISNVVEDRDRSTWDIPQAAGAAQQAVLRILEAWKP